MYRARPFTIALIAAGAALGYADAAIDFQDARSARAASPSGGPATRAEQSGCCSESGNKGLLLARAENTAASRSGTARGGVSLTRENSRQSEALPYKAHRAFSLRAS
jgi:hypothetical protein